LVALPEVARACGVAQVWAKDEGRRFGVGSFKSLGGALVVDDLARASKGGVAGLTVCTASAGNHGLGVAWGAKRVGCRSVVYVGAKVSERIAAKMRALGAEVSRVEGGYEDSVQASLEASKQGMTLVQDMSWPGYEEVPQRIQAGYTLVAEEILDQLQGQSPTHVFVNAGVGGFAAGVFGYLCERLGPQRPTLVTVEPTGADCVFRKAAGHKPRDSTDTVQTGLDTKEVSPLAWRVLGPCCDHFCAVGDACVSPSMRLLAAKGVCAGESGVAGLGLLLAAAARPELQRALRLDASSKVCIVVCEQPPDPATFVERTGLTVEQVRR